MTGRLLALLIIVGLCIPFSITAVVPEAETAVPSQEDTDTSTIPRVYGTDHSREVYAEITQETYHGFVRNFSEIGNRHILEAADAYTGNNMEAREYIIDCMHNLSQGRMEVEVIEKHLNVVGRLPGYLPGNKTGFAIVGHYDNWYYGMGANEGGAGIGALLTLIEPLSAYEWPLDIYFVATNGRYAQWGPFGPKEIALWFQNQGIQLLMIYTMEALLFPNPEAPQDERVELVYLDAGDSNFHIAEYWAELARAMSKNIGLNLIKTVPHDEFYYWGGRYLEATYFLERGFFQTLVAVESGLEIDDIRRTVEDTWDNPTYRYYLGSEITGAIGASIAFTMSRAYGEPVNKTNSFELERGTTRNFYMPISTPTTINVVSRWFGGTAEFEILDPSGSVIASQTYDRTSAWEPTNVFSLSVSQKGLYRLRVSNNGFSPVGHVLQYSYESDIDGNGIPDSEEYWLDTALFEEDSDLDTMSDAIEIIYGTDPDSADSDLDTMPDAYEFDNGFDPNDPADALEDADGDTLTNAQEYALGTDPFNIDSDFDKIPDNWEIQYGLDPLSDDSQEDPDGDERSNLEEYRYGSNPMVAERAAAIPIVWYIVPLVVVGSSVAVYGWKRRSEPKEEDYTFI